MNSRWSSGERAPAASAVGLLLEGRSRARDAQARLGLAPGSAATAEGGGPTGFRAAFDLHFDNFFTDVVVHDDIVKTLYQVRAMLQVVEGVLAEQFGS
ncbi:MAG TPA: hypothetical protein VIK91_10650 [Nannocystis sp.]